MRAANIFVCFLVALPIGVSMCWATNKSAFIFKQRAAAEWVSLTLADRELFNSQTPQNSAAALFLSDAVLDRGLKQLVGTTITLPGSTLGKFIVTIRETRIRPAVGHTGAVVDVDIENAPTGISVTMELEGTLTFRGITSVDGAPGLPAAMAEFAVDVERGEPKLKWGFMDVPGRFFLSQAISSGLMVVLDHDLKIAVPFEDGLTFDTGFNSDATIKVPDGTVSLNTSLQGAILRQRFSFATPLFLQSGVWLMAASSSSGQAPVVSPALPAMAPAELERQISTLRRRVSEEGRDFEQTNDLVLLVNGSALVSLVDKLRALPESNRTVVVRSTGTTGHLINNDTILLELPEPHAVKATLVIGYPSATWSPTKGVAVAADISMNLNASVHVHVKPVINAGTVLGLVGNSGKYVAGTLGLTQSTFEGHSALTLGATMPCDTLTADVTTDGRLVWEGIKVDLVKVGVRWTMPVPSSLGQPNLVLDDLPRRVALKSPEHNEHGALIRPAHRAVEYTVHVTDARATQIGYKVTAMLEMSLVDALSEPPEVSAQRQKLEKSIKSAARAGTACPSVDPDMKVLFGGAEFGKNNEFVKAFTNMLHDLQHGPGPSNDVVGKDGFVAKKAGQIAHDALHGPGPNNDLVGKNGAVRRALGF